MASPIESKPYQMHFSPNGDGSFHVGEGEYAPPEKEITVYSRRQLDPPPKPGKIRDMTPDHFFRGKVR